MELMRHTDLRLTMKVYTDPRIFDTSAAVERLPSLKPLAQILASNSVSDRHDVAQPGNPMRIGGGAETPQNTEELHELAPTGSDAQPAKICPRWDSNPHGPFGPSDFKSEASAIPPRGRVEPHTMSCECCGQSPRTMDAPTATGESE